MTTTRKIALRAADEAVANIGVAEEGSSNWGKAIKIYLNSVGITIPAPWCAAFVYFRLKNASEDLGLTLPSFNPHKSTASAAAFIPRSGYTPDWKNAAQKVNRFVPVSQAKSKKPGTYNVERGDLALFYFANMKRIAHIGIVDEVTPTGVWTIEGNTSGTGEGVERNGGEVARKFRRWGSLGLRGGFMCMD